MEDIKVCYVKVIANLSLEKFNIFVLKIQKRGDKYRVYIAGQYYLFLIRGLLRDKFMETFLKIV